MRYAIAMLVLMLAFSVSAQDTQAERAARGRAILGVTGPTPRDVANASPQQIQQWRCQDVRDKIETQLDLEAAGSSGVYNLKFLRRLELHECGTNLNEADSPASAIKPNPHVLENSDDLKCGNHRPCSDSEVSEQAQDIYKKWPRMPESVKSSCGSKLTLSDMQICIELKEITLLGENPKIDRSWFPDSAK